MASSVSYTWSSASATSSYGSWSTSAPTIDAAGSNDYFFVDVTFVDATGEATSSNGSSVTSAARLFNFNGLVTFTNENGTTSLQDALDDDATTIDGGKITTNTITAGEVNVDGATLSTDASGNLIIAPGGVGSTQFASSIQSDNYQANTSGWKIDRANDTAEFGAAVIRGTLSAANINLTGSQLQNSGGALVISALGVDTDEIANSAISTLATSYTASAAVPYSVGQPSTGISSVSSSGGALGDKYLGIVTVGWYSDISSSVQYINQNASLGTGGFSQLFHEKISGGSYAPGSTLAGIFTATTSGTVTLSFKPWQSYTSTGTVNAKQIRMTLIRLKR
jgi:hypothetical protein